jgi:hypothetical protein
VERFAAFRGGSPGDHDISDRLFLGKHGLAVITTKNSREELNKANRQYLIRGLGRITLPSIRTFGGPTWKAKATWLA